MTKNYYYFSLGASVNPNTIAQLDEIRGHIPRSKLVERALRRFVADVQAGKAEINDTKQD
jgi:hypothetical protein